MKALSLDIETYGKVLGFPVQTQFHPCKSVAHDGTRIRDLVHTCSLTLVDLPSLDLQGLASLSLHETMVFDMSKLSHVSWLSQWLDSCPILLGTHLLFDVSYLRFAYPLLALRPFEHKLVDLTACIYLESETTTHRGLKAYGKRHALFEYADDIRDLRFPPSSKELLRYNAEDTHNTALAIRKAANDILLNYGPDTHKLSPFSISHFSDTIWSMVLLSLAGIHFHVPSLLSLNENLQRGCDRLIEACPFPLSGKGSQLYRDDLADRILKAHRNILDDRRIEWTKGGKFSWNSSNCNTLLGLLSPSETPEARETVTFLGHYIPFSRDSKIVSSFLRPLLSHQGKDESKVTCRLLHPRTLKPLDHSSPFRQGVAFSQYYALPSATHDDSSDSGGTVQGRTTGKNPSPNVWPPSTQDCIVSRFPGGHLVSYDADAAELFTAALLSGEPELLKAFDPAHPIDLHTETAVTVYSEEVLFRRHPPLQDLPRIRWKTLDAFSSQERATCKMVNFASLFNARPSTIRTQILAMTGKFVDLPSLTLIWARTKISRPVLHRWQLSLCEQARDKGHLELPFIGQSRLYPNFRFSEVIENYPEHGVSHLPVLHEEFPDSRHRPSPLLPTITNQFIQTLTANFIIHLESGIERRLLLLPPPRPILFKQVYDSLSFDCPRSTEPTLLQGIVDDALESLRSPEGLLGKFMALTSNAPTLTLSRS